MWSATLPWSTKSNGLKQQGQGYIFDLYGLLRHNASAEARRYCNALAASSAEYHMCWGRPKKSCRRITLDLTAVLLSSSLLRQGPSVKVRSCPAGSTSGKSTITSPLWSWGKRSKCEHDRVTLLDSGTCHDELVLPYEFHWLLCIQYQLFLSTCGACSTVVFECELGAT